jgi:hypothetical protein
MNAVPSADASEQSIVASVLRRSMASRVQRLRLFSTLRALRHDNPLVSKCQFSPSRRL